MCHKLERFFKDGSILAGLAGDPKHNTLFSWPYNAGGMKMKGSRPWSGGRSGII